MNILRRLPLSRLLLLCGVVVAVGVCATALASALGTGPTPPAQAARARRSTTRSPARAPVEGVSAQHPADQPSARRRHLASERRRRRPAGLEPAAHRRLGPAVDRQGRPRAPGAAVRTGRHRRSSTTATPCRCTTRPPNTLYRYTPPRTKAAGRRLELGRLAATTKSRASRKIEEAISHLSEHANVVRRDADRRRRPARLHGARLPEGRRQPVGGAELSWDADHGVPLRAAIYSTHQLRPGDRTGGHRNLLRPGRSSVFELTPPANAKMRRSRACAAQAHRKLGDTGHSRRRTCRQLTTRRPRAHLGRRARKQATTRRQEASRRCRRPAEGQDRRRRPRRSCRPSSARCSASSARACDYLLAGAVEAQRRSKRSRGASSVIGTPADASAARTRRDVPASAMRRAGAAPPVKARGLVKRYKEVLAVDHVDLNVHAGDVYGFLGPNGAGKTTTLRMAPRADHAERGRGRALRPRPDARGRARARGRRGLRRGAALLPLSDRARKNLELLAALDGDGAAETRSTRCCAIVELCARAKHKVGGYSHGMRQRLGIAAALLRRPRLLILDEPATGLDPAGHARHARADPPARRRGDHGAALEPPAARGAGTVRPRGDRRLRDGSSTRARSRSCAARAERGYRLRTDDDARALQIARAQPGIHELAPAASTGCASRRTERDVGALSLALGQAGVAILALTPELATLEDLFFGLTEGDER